MEKGLFKSFAKYVSLNILGMIGLSCYILADTYFISKSVGSIGIAALNFSIPVYSLIHGIGLMIGIGGASRFTILRWENKKEKANEVFSSSIKVGFLIGVLFIAIGVLGSKYLAIALGADNTTLSLTKTYLTTLLSFAPFFIINNIFITFVRNDNNPKLSMIAMLVGSFSNIILDYIFVFPFNMGMFGAALATGVAPIVSICILLYHLTSDKNTLKFIKIKLKIKRILDIFKLGLSSFIIEISSAVVLITFNLVILRIEGNIGVAAYGIVANLALVGIAILTGLAQGIQPLTSKYYGLLKKDIVKRVYHYAIVTSIIIGGLLYICVRVYSKEIIGIFNSENNSHIAKIADMGLKIYFIGFLFVGINIVTAIFFSSIEKAKYAFSITILRGLIIIVPMVIVMSGALGMVGVWFAFVFTELIVTAVVIYLMKKALT